MTAPPVVVAETGQVRIRERRKDDAVNEYRWRRDPELARYDASRPVTMPFSEFFRIFERELATHDPTRHTFALEAADGTHIGTIMFYDAQHSSGAAEFGISVADAEYQGRGIGREATIAFLRWLWATTPFRRVSLHTLEWNRRAIACFEAAGFQTTARVFRRKEWFLRMEARREWWLLWDTEGRFGASRPV